MFMTLCSPSTSARNVTFESAGKMEENSQNPLVDKSFGEIFFCLRKRKFSQPQNLINFMSTRVIKNCKWKLLGKGN